jgi:hypothetical protein
MTSGVDRFVSFGHRCWIFAKKQEKICKKKLFPKEKFRKKGKNLGVG